MRKRRGRLRPLDERLRRLFFDAYEQRTKHTVWKEDTIGDGSCFYHALALVANLNNYTCRKMCDRKRIGHNFRRSISNLLKSNQKEARRNKHAEKYFSDPRWADKMEKWDSFWDALRVPAPDKRQMRKRLDNTAQWANATDIMFLMWLLECDIVFIDEKGCNVYCGVENKLSGHVEKHDANCVLILWENRAHFMPIVVEHHGGRIQRRFRSEEEPFASVKKHYATFCKGVLYRHVAPRS